MKISNKNYEKRKSIFNIYANNLKLLLASNDKKLFTKENNRIKEVTYPVYVCPLCFRSFNEQSIIGSNPHLTLEHNPPKSLRGHASILTCKACNNSSGQSMDNALLESITKKPFLNGIINSSINANFNVNNCKIKGELKIVANNELLIEFNDKTNPYKIDEIKKYISNNEGQIELNFFTPDIKTSKRAKLKIAYLELFALFGYSFIFDDNIKKIREAIFNKDSKTPIFIIKDTGQFTAEHVGLNMITLPKEFSNFLIVIPLKKDNQIFYMGVIIPKSGKEGWKNYLSSKKLKSKIEFTNYANYQGIIKKPELIYDYYNFSHS
jgi:hypothetical protein